MARVITDAKYPSHSLARQLQQQGYQSVAGVDEVGRGCIAGPLVVGAVILDSECEIPGARDSKLLGPAKRFEIARYIKSKAVAIGLGWASANEIDHQGLSYCLRSAGLRALENLGTAVDAVILDGTYDFLKTPTKCVYKIGADSTSLSVACASIIAKVARDQYMEKMHHVFPDYGFDKHKGYGTKLHYERLLAGVSPIHRTSFAGVRGTSDVG